jgi:parallel beta-helix repeat protein
MCQKMSSIGIHAIAVILFASNCIAQTDIPAGNISGTWAKANSPYHINGEITIPNGETLTIEPGVMVIFTGHYKFNVQGRLLAVGTEQDTITFTAQDPETGWHGIRFINTPKTNDSSKIVYCSLKYGKANTGTDLDKCGGAISVYNFSKLLISNCLINSNMNSGDLAAANAGGAICIQSSSPVIENNVISYNTAVGNHGGGIAIAYAASPVIKNNVIFRNHAAGGGGIYIYGGSPVFMSNTIVENRADWHGGAACIDGGSSLFLNTILFGNTAAVGNQFNLQNASQPSFYFCVIEGGKNSFSRNFVNGGSYSGIYESNIETDPLFLNIASDDYHLSDTSPCIGAGGDSIQVNAKWYYAPTSDFLGIPRPNPMNSHPDIGAFENALSSPLTGIREAISGFPNEFHLNQNYPNPFNPSTSIGYSIPKTGHVKLTVYDLLGREVSVLVDETKTTGTHAVQFDASRLPSGIYIYRFESEGQVQSKKLMLMK